MCQTDDGHDVLLEGCQEGFGLCLVEMQPLSLSGIGVVNEYIDGLRLQRLDQLSHTLRVAEVNHDSANVLKPRCQCLCLVFMSAVGEDDLIICIGGTRLYQCFP